MGPQLRSLWLHRRPAIRLAVSAVVIGLAAMACVAPLMRGPAREPTRHLFIGAHGVPNAYGDGVCAFTARHTHAYPPVPQRAFDLEGDAWRDRRAMFPFFDPHPHPKRSCFRVGWHLHLEPPLPTLRYRSDVAAFAESGDAPLDVFGGTHDECAVGRPHGHVPRRSAEGKGPALDAVE